MRMDDEGRYYCIAENKFGRETVNGLLLVRSMDFCNLCSCSDLFDNISPDVLTVCPF